MAMPPSTVRPRRCVHEMDEEGGFFRDLYGFYVVFMRFLSGFYVDLGWDFVGFNRIYSAFYGFYMV